MRENSKLTPHAKDQVLGCMVGGAVGDALGYAVEFASYDSIVKKYGEKGITRFDLDRHGVAEISDDTQMSLFTASGILLGMPAWILGSWTCRCQSIGLARAGNSAGSCRNSLLRTVFP